jgi:hypothetical protein
VFPATRLQHKLGAVHERGCQVGRDEKEQGGDSAISESLNHSRHTAAAAAATRNHHTAAAPRT